MATCSRPDFLGAAYFERKSGRCGLRPYSVVYVSESSVQRLVGCESYMLRCRMFYEEQRVSQLLALGPEMRDFRIVLVLDGSDGGREGEPGLSSLRMKNWGS